VSVVLACVEGGKDIDETIQERGERKRKDKKERLHQPCERLGRARGESEVDEVGRSMSEGRLDDASERLTDRG
jgi:hypothetical protein